MDGHFRTVGLSLKFHPPPLLCTARGGKTNRSTCIKRSSRDWESGACERIVPNLSGDAVIQDSRPLLWTSRSSLTSSTDGSLFPCLGNRDITRRIMQMPPVRRFLAVCLTLFGYLGDVYTGTVLVNSNAIKNLPGASGGGKGADTVSPSPRTSPSGSVAHKLPVDTLQQSGVCTDDEDCGGDEFCNDARGVCLPCRKSRKRCARDSMCCAGNRCSNGVCQANDIDGTDASIITGWQKHNSTTEHHAKKPPTAHSNQPHAAKGQEGDTCLRSADCSEGLCCARHFWSRICKPVLTEGQVCTRHRRKGTHGLELFQRCDCGDGLACRPEKGERDHSVSRTAARNLHTCQRR